MYNPSLKTDIEENNKTTRYNILLNDATKSDEADQRYSNYQQQLSEGKCLVITSRYIHFLFISDSTYQHCW